MSLLIKNVQVIDGEGNPPRQADVFVQKNIIAAIGDLKSKGADETIDGLGNYLTPGFIDIDTDSDHYLDIFTNPSQSDFTNQGVTTIIGGHCGSSLAPLLYGTLEGIEKWANPSQVNVNWHTVAELLTSLERIPLGVNFGTLVGHATVRRALTNEAERALTKKELAVFKKILTQALSEGAFGLSTGLGYVHGRTARDEEIKELVETLKSFDGIYTTHLRSQTDRLLPSVKETISIASDTGVRTIISHLRPLKGYENQFSKALELIRSSAANASVHFDIYPHDTSIYSIYALLPREIQKKNAAATMEYLNRKGDLKEIERQLQVLNPDDMWIASAPNHEYFVGKTIREIASNLEVTPAKAILKIMLITGLKATVFYRDINYDLLLQALTDERAFIASNGNSPLPGKFMKHERSTNTFPKFLELVTKQNIGTSPALPLEQAIRKITSLPARYFNLKDRGVVKEGKIADLVILGKDDLKVRGTVVGGRRVDRENISRRGAILRHKTR
jgi:N-acyl-D-amino-acid deacylase